MDREDKCRKVKGPKQGGITSAKKDKWWWKTSAGTRIGRMAQVQELGAGCSGFGGTSVWMMTTREDKCKKDKCGERTMGKKCKAQV